MKKVAILLADGFEEAEAIIVIDLLRRFEIHVDILACQNELTLNAYFGIKIQACHLLMDKFKNTYDAIVMVGGPKNTDSIGGNQQAINFIKRHQTEDKFICALCSAGAKVLARNGLIGNKNYVATAELYKNFDDGHYINQSVVQDGKLITGKDLGVAFDFVMAIATNLIGDRQEQSNNKNFNDVDWQASHISYDKWFITKKELMSN
jgi:putative intracellular protease/amidase